MPVNLNYPAIFPYSKDPSDSGDALEGGGEAGWVEGGEDMLSSYETHSERSGRVSQDGNCGFEASLIGGDHSLCWDLSLERVTGGGNRKAKEVLGVFGVIGGGDGDLSV